MAPRGSVALRGKGVVETCCLLDRREPRVRAIGPTVPDDI